MKRYRHSLSCVDLDEDDEATVVAWYDVPRQQWRWRCSLCHTEHGTTSSETWAARRSDIGWPRRYEGPVQTAMRNHIDRIHAEDDVAIEIREPG
jgi:hypothetical protein